MWPLKKMLTFFDGLYFPQEYLCLAKESFTPLLHAYLVEQGRAVRDITSLHLFTGYCPLVFTFFAPADSLTDLPGSMEILFTETAIKTNAVLPQKVALAGLSLRCVHRQRAGDLTLFFYEGLHGWHRFIPPSGQWIGRLRNRLYNRKPGNVYLPGNLHTQVQVAYALPRKICLITVGSGGWYNLFPTDLHGAAGASCYVISLRHAGKACSQVEAAGRVVLSDMDASACKKVFRLGKNHMQPPREKAAFDFGPGESEYFHLPLPQDAVAYTELELAASFLHGIHKLLIFRVVCRETIRAGAGTLAHIHNSYATWRHKKQLPGNYLLR